MKKSVRLLTSFILVFLLLFAALSVSAFAAPSHEKKPHPVTGRQRNILYAMVDDANNRIQLAVINAQNTPEDDVAELLALVDEIIAEVTAYADSIGAELACEYTEYVVDGQTVLIDPIRVVNIPGSGVGKTK